jgi:hypothetical protein
MAAEWLARDYVRFWFEAICQFNSQSAFGKREVGYIPQTESLVIQPVMLEALI